MLVVAAVALAAGTATAQPVPLLPRPAPPAVSPAPTPAAEAPAPVAKGQPTDNDRILVGPIGALDPSAVGTLYDADGGLGVEMWRGSPRPLVETLIPLLPAVTRSAAQQSLARRLLLTAATVPEGEMKARSLLGLRLERLVAMGMADEARALGRAMAASIPDPVLQRALIDAWWIVGDDSAACDRLSQLVRDDPDPHWLKGLTVCQVAAGQQTEFGLAQALLRDQGIDDTTYFSVATALTNPKGAVASLAYPQPLYLAMLRAGRKPIPPDALKGAGPAALAMIARSDNAAPDLRVAAAEQAEANGALAASALAGLYGEVKVDSASQPTVDKSPRAAALLYQNAHRQTVAVARAEALRRVWAQARERHLFETAARTTVAMTRELQPAPELVFFGAEAARALLAAGDSPAAGAWWRFLRQRAEVGDSDAAQAADGLWPLVAIAGAAPTGWDEAGFRGWRDRPGEATAEARTQQAAIALVLMDAAGVPVPPERWQDYYGASAPADGAGVSPALWRGLTVAAEGGRRGETVLFALLILGPGGPRTADPIALAAVASALRRVGLEADARALALEAALARGM